jgi:hypothetical protein
MAVGETLALPVRLLGQVEPGEIAVSPEIERLIEGWVTLEARALRLRSRQPGHLGGAEVAYQSVPANTRRQDHQRIAQVLVEQFPALAETRPALLAHHCTEAGDTARAITAWQRAGQRAAERGAHLEAIAHFTRGLELLQCLPDTRERTQ